jgi:hypothetical protein
MPQVVIQPSFGNRVARQNWHKTVDASISFTSSPYSTALSGAETKRLLSLHPDGSTQFWGSASNQDQNYRRLSTGDLVLFTGQKRVQAVGQVGVILRNRALGDLFWDPDPEKGSWLNIYSLQGLDRTDIPYEEIWALPGFNPGDNFMGMRIVDPERGRALIDGLKIQADGTNEGPSPEEARRLAHLAERVGQVTAAEKFSTDSTSYQQSAGTVHVRRAESLLVTAFRASRPDERDETLRTLTGLADYYAREPDNLLVEAKSSAKHTYVRQALGQLLDYSRFTPKPSPRLAALFPQRPADEGVKLLHDYGIECIFLDSDGTFVTE